MLELEIELVAVLVNSGIKYCAEQADQLFGHVMRIKVIESVIIS